MDTELVVRAQRGDKEAYALLVTPMADRFLAVARRILRDISLAEDATQQALLSAWRDLPQLRDPARFEAWSYRLLVRACYAEGRSERRWAPNLRLLPADEPMARGGLDSVVDRDELERGFRRLSIDHRTVVVLHHYLDLPLDRVADLLGIPTGTAYSRLHYAMRALRAAPDGRWITFAGEDADGAHLYVTATDGSSVRIVATGSIDPGYDIITPVWSPDGQWIAFVAKARTGDQGTIYLIRPDGSELHRLATERVTVGDGGFISWAPDPDVLRLLYLHDRPPRRAAGLTPPDEGGVHVHLFDVVTEQDYDTGLGFWPAWSPDGTRISGCCASIVDTADVIAGDPRQVTVFAQPEGNCPDLAEYTGEAICSAATWSPDGSTLIAADIADSALLMAAADGSGTPVTVDLETATWRGAHWTWQPIAA